MRTRKHGAFAIIDGDRKTRRRQRRELRDLIKDKEWEDSQASRVKKDDDLPKKKFKGGGDPSPKSGFGAMTLKDRGVKVAAHTAATAFPFVSGPSLGTRGNFIGQDLNGGGAFNFDPWELYDSKIISGMSIIVFGTVGTGKSSLVKAMAMRMVGAGRKLAVASDLKGEWTRVVRRLGGPVIQVGPGLGTCINPLDEGVRPSVDRLGEPMTDEKWALVVRTRRLSILETLLKVLTGADELTPAEHAALELGVDQAVEYAADENRSPIISDVITGLKDVEASVSAKIASACEDIALSLGRMTTGDVAGMFNGESTERFQSEAPAVSIDTSAMRGATPTARRMVSICCAAWLEAMVSNSDSGKRIVVYEEGWDSVTNRADLERMVENWKLARDYGIFNVLLMHKVTDLDMAGDAGSQMAAMANSLLADADVKVIYRQDAAALKATTNQLELNERERTKLRSYQKGEGLWRVGQASFEVYNKLTSEEEPLLDTDQRTGAEAKTDDFGNVLVDDWVAA